MRVLPIVERELRVAARQRGTYWIRMAAALVALLIMGWVWLVTRGEAPRILGMALFVSLSIFSFVYCILAGLRTTADCLSEEKREGTMGLLFLTDLRGYDVVLGKLVATSLNAIYGLMAVVPIMAIPLLLGGVTGAEFWRVVLCLLNNLFFSLSVGMLASSISKDERKAMFMTLAILLVFVFGLPLAGGLLLEWLEPRGFELVFLGFFMVPSPGYASFGAFDETYQMLSREKFNLFYASLTCVHLLSWGMLWVACLIVPRSWRDRVETAGQVRRRRWLQRLKHGGPESRKSRRVRMLARNPMFWLTGRDRFKPVLVFLFLGAGGLLWLWGILTEPRDWLSGPAYVLTALGAHTGLKLWLASEACRQFALDRRSGALELLLSTPMRVREIVRGQLSSLRGQFLWPILAVLLVDFLFLLSDSHDEQWVILCLAGMGIFVADMVGLSWLGMWFGLVMGRVGRATASAVFCIMVLPWIVYGGVMTMLAVSGVLQHLSRHVSRNSDVYAVALWAAIGLATDLVFGLAARERLLNRFRRVAPRRAPRRHGAAAQAHTVPRPPRHPASAASG